ncbi:phosphoglycolate phosphatase [Bacillus cereus]|uniref:phosphoglycolate phosphatase n=1 Tax=Bacillus cereus TaxID=1396 RepID=UPI000BFD9131|nr:phosphoglycolate phosphatase [Bacillus cereus]PGS40891.1 phosphoglycolate phosphatase [Bacillus cereus]PGU35938.1 phosphoglycolate phosphatase [Bacillus cereus]
MERKLLRYGIMTIAFLTIPMIFILLVSSQSIPKEYGKEWPEVKRIAELVTIGYFKKEKNLEIVIDKISPSEEYRTHEIFLYGHVTDNELQKVYAVVNFSEHYSVEDISEYELKSKSS